VEATFLRENLSEKTIDPRTGISAYGGRAGRARNCPVKASQDIKGYTGDSGWAALIAIQIRKRRDGILPVVNNYVPKEHKIAEF
jgi:hypothetical protein